MRPFDIERETKPGKYADGGGLYLIVASATAKNWAFRYWIEGKERWHGRARLSIDRSEMIR
ncbi:MAG: Arm DNA-binding domain-containing protein [Pseudomonadota bacterium]